MKDFYIGVGPDEDEYKIDSKGLFLIIRNDEFPFDNVPSRQPLDYVEDQKSIEQAFNLLNEDGTPQANVYIGENLRDESVSDSDTDPENVYRNKSLESFMKAVQGYRKTSEAGPSFVMFFLMSHGADNGQFLLSYTEESKKENSWRNLTTHIIEPIQEIYKSIPKIFIIQTCRGARDDDILATDSLNTGEAAEPSMEGFIPRSADTLILYPCAAGQVSYAWIKGSQRGSFLMSEFVRAVAVLGLNLSSVHGQQQMIDEMRGVAGRYTQPSPLGGTHAPVRLDVNLESLLNAWLTDICRTTACQVAQKYMWEKQYK